MPNRKGANRQAMKSPQLLAMMNRILAQPHLFQLRPPHHPVLAPCQPRNRNL